MGGGAISAPPFLDINSAILHYKYVNFIIHWCFIPLAVTFLVLFSSCQSSTDDNRILYDDFEGGELVSAQWQVTSSGDFSDIAVDVTDTDESENIDFQLRMRAGTLNTTSQMKYLGIRSAEMIDISNDIVITFDLDWNNQANGCYLGAGLYLCPFDSDNPKVEDDWIKFEYVGVPPGKNVRINIWKSVNGSPQEIFTDWGPRDAQGKPLGLPLGQSSHTIRIELDPDALAVWQDDTEIIPPTKHNLQFTEAYLYLQMSSGTNYPPREVYFDNVLIQSVIKP